MKKSIAAAAVLAVVLGMTACSSQQQASPSTESATEATSDTAAEAAAEASQEETEETTEEEEIEEDYFSGTITAMEGDILTVKSDSDETERRFDVSNAEITQEYPFSEGDMVDITFQMDTTEDPVPALYLEVLESVIGENTDPTVEGVITDATTNTITLEVDGENYTLGRSNAYVVAANGLTNGLAATVTYFGILEDEATAVKIVTEDSYDTPEAEIDAYVGEVAQIEDNNIVLVSEEGEFFTFVSDELDFSAYEVGDTVQISYEGTITAKEIPAVSIASY